MRALVYRTLGLGDLLTGVPALRQLRRALPRHEITLAAPAAQAPLVGLTGAVDRLLPTEELAPVAWSGPPPEIAVDLHGNGPASLCPVASLGAARVVGYAREDSPEWPSDLHERERWCLLLKHALGVPGDPDDVLLQRPPVASQHPGAVVVHPGAASASRRWPPERYAEVVAALSSRGAPVVVTGSEGERTLVEEVVARSEGATPLVGPDLTRLAALVAEARLVVCGDTGVAHLASAYATPSVVLFGPTPPSLWGPPPGPHRVLWHGEGPGDPHADVVDPALLEITVEEVVDASLIQGRFADPG